MSFKIVKAHSGINFSGFKSSEHTIQHYVRKRLWQQHEQGDCTAYVLINEQSILVGFYTFSPVTVSRETLNRPENYPYSEVSFLLLGRMGIDKHFVGQGLGKVLMGSVILKAHQALQDFGGRGLAVDALNDELIDFYLRFGFRSLPSNPRRLILSRQDIEACCAVDE